jgi:hypothetical protein
MSIYSKTIEDGNLGPNAPNVGSKIAYVIFTVMHALEPGTAKTDASEAQSALNRLVALGIDPRSTAMRSLRYDLNNVIERQRQ